MATFAVSKIRLLLAKKVLGVNKFVHLVLILVIVLVCNLGETYAQCDPTTPEFIIDLSGNADSVWIETNTARLDSCCYQESSDPCISFVVTLAPQVAALYFSVENPQPSVSASQFHINCDTTIYSVQDTVCMTGYSPPYTITYCKPGNDKPDYVITGIGAGEISPPITVSEACSDTLYADGFVESTLVWTSIPSDSTLESFLSCTTGCDTVLVTPVGSYPDSIQYKICGDVSGFDCGGGGVNRCDSTWVYFISTLDVSIAPDTPSICFGGSGVILTATPVGGATPYSYLWSTGSTTDTIQILLGNAGTYWVSVTDSSGCPAATDTVVVTEFINPITANAGNDTGICVIVSSLTLNGSVTGVSTGIWSGGGGTFNPAADVLNANYTPTSAEISAGSVSLVLVTTNNGSCPADTDTVIISIDTIPVTANAGPDQLLCELTSTTLAGNDPSPGTGLWSVLFGGSNPTTPTSETSALTNLTTGNQDTLIWTTENGVCPASVDTVVIIVDVAPTVSAASDDTICEGTTHPLAGSFGGGASSIYWTTTGSGSFNDTTLVGAVYTPSAGDITAGTVDLVIHTNDPAGPCGLITDTMTLQIDLLTNVSANVDDTICEGDTYTLSGSFGGGAISSSWSTAGSGTFDDSTLIAATYTPSAGDITTGSVILIHTSNDPPGPCSEDMDSMLLIISSDQATVDAGPDSAVCITQDTIPFEGTITVAPGATWSSSGSGSFSPSADSLSTNYIPSTGDTLAGFVTLTLTTTGNGACLPKSDSLVLNFVDIAVVDAGTDVLLCLITDSTSLSGTLATPGDTLWTTTGAGTFIPGANVANPIYVPGDAGMDTLILSAVSGCPISDTVLINVIDGPTVNAGADTSVCAPNPNVLLTGTVTVVSGATWVTLGSGSFSPSDTSLTTTYIPSIADTAAGSVIIVLISDSVVTCFTTDTVVITYTPDNIAVDAGPDIVLCNTNSSVAVVGSVTTASGGVWTSTGSGSFTPSDTALSTNYNPSPGDVSSGFVTLILTTTGNGGCLPKADSLLLTVIPIPAVNAGTDTALCSLTDTFYLGGTVSGVGGGYWTSSDGAGVFIVDSSTLNTIYYPSGIGLDTLVLTANGCVNTDTVMIDYYLGPIVDAGPDTSVCRTNPIVVLIGSVTGVPVATWTSTGSGTLTPSDTSMTVTYTPSTADTVAGSVTIYLTSDSLGPCTDEDTLVITYTDDQITVDAGADTMVCITLDSVPINGNVTIAFGGTWSSSGTGIFSPSTDSLSTYYLPSGVDTAAGSVTLYLTTTGNGGCTPKIDSMTLGFIELQNVNAGSDVQLCVITDSVQLAGTVSSPGIGTWTTSGIGVFVPDANSLGAVYVPIVAGFDTITLTANSGCPVSDVLILEVIDGPDADAGSDVSVCKTNPNVTLSGTITVVSGSAWSSSGTGIFVPDDSSLNTTYIPSIADTAAGNVIITLTTDSLGPCIGTDQLTITYTLDDITVDAGPDTVVCKIASSVPIQGTIGIATGGTWATTGSGTFSPSADSLSTNYLPSSGDTAAGQIELILTSTGNGGCASKSDTMILTFFPDQSVYAGNDTVLCVDNDTLPLAGFISGGGFGIWTSTGTGTFFPTDTTLVTSYILSSQDQFNGLLSLMLTSNTVGFCAVADTMNITVIPNALAGPDQFLCITDDTLELTGSVGGASGGIWTCTPPCTGSFFPSNTLVSTSYILSATDSANGVVFLVLSSTGNLLGCPSASDTMSAFILPAPTVDAGADTIYVCSSTGIADLSGTVTNALGGIWSTNGSGNFFPSADSLTTTYVMSSADTGQPFIVVTLTTTASCLTPSDSVILVVIPGPTADFTYTEICLNDSMYFVDITQDNTVEEWYWDFGDGITDTVQDPAHLFNADGIYNVTLGVVTVNGCLDTLTQPILVHSLPIADYTFAANCVGEIASFTDQSTVASDTINGWTWDFGNGDSAFVSEPTEQFNGESDYLVTLIVSSSWGCVDTIVDTISIVPNPIANFIFEESCYPDQVTFLDSSYIDNSIAIHNIVEWYWDFGDLTTDSTQSPTPHQYPNAGSFEVQLIVVSEDGCTDTVSKSIDVHAKPVAAFSFDNVCEIDSAYFNDSSYVASPDSIVSWEWFFGDGNTSTQISPSHIYENYGSFIVELIVNTNNGCADTLQDLVIVSPNPIADFTADDFNVTTEDLVNFTDLSPGTSILPDTVDIVNWFWDFYYPTNGAGDSTTSAQNPTYFYTDTGTYQIQLIVTNEYGCIDTTFGWIEVGLHPVVASGFSPDGAGDGANDKLVVHGGPYQELKFIIYNEWGEVIFESNNQDIGWDGTFKGVPQPMGVYVYTVIATSLDGKSHHFWGDVTLLR